MNLSNSISQYIYEYYAHVSIKSNRNSTWNRHYRYIYTMQCLLLFLIVAIVCFSSVSAQIPCDDEYGIHCPEFAGMFVLTRVMFVYTHSHTKLCLFRLGCAILLEGSPWRGVGQVHFVYECSRIMR
jgi:hypothetical protein